MPTPALAEEKLHHPFGRTEGFVRKVVIPDENRVEYYDADNQLRHVEDLYADGVTIANSYPVDDRRRKHGRQDRYDEFGKLQEQCDYVHDVIHGRKIRYVPTKQSDDPVILNITEYMNGYKNGQQILWPDDPVKEMIDYCLDDNTSTEAEWLENKDRVEREWQVRLRELQGENTTNLKVVETPKAAAPAKETPIPDEERGVIAIIRKPPAIRSDWYAEPGPTKNSLIIRDAEGRKRRTRYLHPDGKVKQESCYDKDGRLDGDSITLDEKGNVILITSYLRDKKTGPQIAFAADGIGKVTYFSGDKQVTPDRWEKLGEVVLPPQLRPVYEIEPVKMKEGTPVKVVERSLPVKPAAQVAPAPAAPTPKKAATPKSEKPKAKLKVVTELDRDDPENAPYFKDRSFDKVVLGQAGKRKFVGKDGVTLWTQTYHPNGAVLEVRCLNKYNQTIDDLLTFNDKGKLVSIIPYSWGRPNGRATLFDAQGQPTSYPCYDMGKLISEEEWLRKHPETVKVATPLKPAEPPAATIPAAVPAAPTSPAAVKEASPIAPAAPDKAAAIIKTGETYTPFSREASFPAINRLEDRYEYLNEDGTVGYIELREKRSGRITEGYFINVEGKKNGDWSKWDASHPHKLRGKGHFKDDIPNGEFKEFAANGGLLSVSNFSMGKKHGPQKQCYPDGRTHITYYIQDKLVGAEAWLKEENRRKAEPEEPADTAVVKVETVAVPPPAEDQGKETRGKDAGIGEELDPNLPENRPYLDLKFHKVIRGGRGTIRFVDEEGVILWLQRNHENGKLKEVRQVNKQLQAIYDVVEFDKNGRKISVTPYVNGQRYGKRTDFDAEGNPSYSYFDKEQITPEEWAAIERKKRKSKGPSQPRGKPLADAALELEEPAVEPVVDPVDALTAPQAAAAPVVEAPASEIRATHVPATTMLDPDSLTPIDGITAYRSCIVDITKRYVGENGEECVETYYPDGKLKSQKFTDAKGRPEKIWREFGENGALRFMDYYMNGTRLTCEEYLAAGGEIITPAPNGNGAAKVKKTPAV